MKTTKGKLRNITSGILHTEIGDVYLFFEEYIGMKGIMTHQLGSACKAIEPILRTKFGKMWFTDEWIKDGLNVMVEVPDLTAEEKELFWKHYHAYASEMWDKIKDKTIIVKT